MSAGLLLENVLQQASIPLHLHRIIIAIVA